MSHMTEQEKKWIEVLLKCCRKQCTTYDEEKQGWKELVKAKEEERLQQEKEERGATQAKKEQQPEAGESGEKASILKVKSSKGKEVVVEQVKEGHISEKAAERTTMEKMKDKSPSKKDKAPKPDKFEQEEYEPPVEFEDPLSKLMEGQEMEEEYTQMTLEEEEAIIAQLTPWKRAEHQEMSEFNQIQAATTGWSHNQC